MNENNIRQSVKEEKARKQYSEDVRMSLPSLVHFAMGLFFILCAYVNLNDPDPLAWVGIYLFASFLSFASFLHDSQYFAVPSLPIAIPVVISLGCILGIIKLVTVIPREALNSSWSFFEVEEGREIGGITILLLEMLLITTTPGRGSRQRFSTKRSLLMNALYWSAFLLVMIAFYATFFLQPMMNQRLQVEHCTGQLFG